MGTTLILEETGPAAPRLKPPPPPPVDRPDPGHVTNGSRPATDDREINWIAGLKVELDGYYAVILGYESQEPDQVLLSISGILSRLTGMRAQLWRANTGRAQNFRTREVDPLIEGLDMQFKVHSRLISMRELDFKMTGPQT